MCQVAPRALERWLLYRDRMNHHALRSRILGIVGQGALLCAVACGGESGDGTSTGTGGVGGAAGSASGGVAGSSGAGGTAGAPALTCFTPDDAWAKTNPPSSDPDAGDAGHPTLCPDSIQAGFCSGYHNLTMVDGECCYTFWNGGSTCGRPFVVDGEARVAAVLRRDDWHDALDVDTTDLDARTLAAIARGWLADARLEHASIASFARFLMHLLAFGAPHDLVSAAQRAAGDEIVHARACFALASRYAGLELGPGELTLGPALAEATLAEAAAAAVTEGCVGETLASLQAAEQLHGARHPAVRRTLETIVRDEAEHAELAWRFVKWALERGGEAVKRSVTRAFDEAFTKIDGERAEAAVDLDEAMMRAHGRLTEEHRIECHERAFEEVIKPCARALLEATSPASVSEIDRSSAQTPM